MADLTPQGSNPSAGQFGDYLVRDLTSAAPADLRAFMQSCVAELRRLEPTTKDFSVFFRGSDTLSEALGRCTGALNSLRKGYSEYTPALAEQFRHDVKVMRAAEEAIAELNKPPTLYAGSVKKFLEDVRVALSEVNPGGHALKDASTRLGVLTRMANAAVETPDRCYPHLSRYGANAVDYLSKLRDEALLIQAGQAEGRGQRPIIDISKLGEKREEWITSCLDRLTPERIAGLRAEGGRLASMIAGELTNKGFAFEWCNSGFLVPPGAR